MLHIHLKAGFNAGRHIASISQQHPAADTFQAATPWLLLFTDGRVRRFGSQTEARQHAIALWAPVKFTRH